MKKIITVLISLIMVLSLSLVGYAEEAVYVVDEFGHLSDGELETLNGIAAEAYEEYGIDIIFVYTYAEDLSEYADESTLGTGADQIIMLENEENWNVFAYGDAVEMFDDADFDALREAYDVPDTYKEGVMAYINHACSVIGTFRGFSDVVSETVAATEAESAAATTGAPAVEEPQVSEAALRLVDGADILTDTEETELLKKLDTVSDKHSCDIVIISVETIEDDDVEDASNTLYELMGYGYGDTDDCLLFLLVMDTRDWAVSKNGFALEAFTNAGFDYIFENVKPELGDNDYSAAFIKYTELCDDFLAKARAGNPYTEDNLPKDPFDIVMNLVIAVAIGIVVSLIVTGGMKGQLKSVRFQSAASNYTKDNSLVVNESRDFFLYRSVTRQEKPKNDSGNSGGGASSRNQSGKF